MLYLRHFGLRHEWGAAPTRGPGHNGLGTVGLVLSLWAWLCPIGGCYSPETPKDSGASDDDAPIDEDGDGASLPEDCDDNNAQIHKSVAEICDGIDNDCDGLIDDADNNVNRFTQFTLYKDLDGDGFGAGREKQYACEMKVGWANSDQDCDDEDPSINPTHPELCDGKDNDCDNLIDDDDPQVDLDSAIDWYEDADEDGYGDPAIFERSCSPPGRTVDNALDCDDRNAAAFPGAPELCDGADNDCDGKIDLANADVSECPAAYATARVQGYGENDRVGQEIAVAGDLNGDGRSEVLVGGPGVSGDDWGVVGIWSTPLPETRQLAGMEARLVGESNGDRLSGGLGLGDLNGDGFGDVLVVAPGSDTFGENNALAWLAYGPVTSPTTVRLVPARLRNLSPVRDGAVTFGAPGDTNGDGFSDLLAASPEWDTGAVGGGSVFLFFGPIGGTQGPDAASLRVDGELPGMELGAALAPGAADFDGDGLADLAVGAPGDPTLGGDAGSVRLFFGPLTGYLLSDAADVMLFGDETSGRMGSHLATGDLDGDGSSDLAIGAPGAADGAGQIHLFLNPATGAVATAGVEGDQEDLGLGEVFCLPGDLDGDGAPDLAAGSPNRDGGQVWVWTGPFGGWSGPSDHAARLQGADPDSALGTRLVGPGDLDGDGRSDLVIGAPGEPGERYAVPNAGAALFYGGADLL